MNWISEIRDYLFNEKEWQEIQRMSDEDLKWEYCRLLPKVKTSRDIQRFRRICYRMAQRFEATA